MQEFDMKDNEKRALSVTILDEDGQPFAVLPPGVAVAFQSSNESVLQVTVHPDGMGADIGSGQVADGETVTVSISGVTPPIADEVITINVKNTEPGSLNVLVGPAELEVPPTPAPFGTRPPPPPKHR